MNKPTKKEQKLFKLYLEIKKAPESQTLLDKIMKLRKEIEADSKQLANN